MSSKTNKSNKNENIFKICKEKYIEELISIIIDDFYGTMLLNEESFNDEMQTLLINKIINYKNKAKEDIKNKKRYRKLTKYNIFMSETLKKLMISHPELEHKDRFKLSTKLWQKNKIENTKVI
jgi:hypothetical protein